jgi:capsular exopolysaccharide synthesis family protein
LTRGLTFLQEQMNSVNEKIEAVEETLSKVSQKDKAIFIPQVDSSSSQLSSDLSNNLKELETELSKTEMDIDWTEAQLQSVRNSISQEEHVSYSSFPPQVGQIQAKLVEMQLQLDSMRENFTEKDPQVVSLQRQVDALKKRLDAELAEIRNNAPNSIYPLSELQNLMQQSVLLDVKLKGLEQKKALLKQNIATFKKEHPDLVTEQMELTSLERQARVHEQTYVMLLEKYEEMSLLKQMEMSRLQILDEAKLPEVVPILPKKNILLLLSLVLGLGLGIGIAFFLEYLDDSIKLKEDVEEYLALPIIGVIPQVKPFKIPNSALNGRGNLAALKSVVSNPKGNLSSSRALASTAGHNSKASNPAVPQKVKSGKRGNGKKRNPKHLKKLLSHILLFAEQKSPVITDYRTLATNIINADVDTPIKTLLIASAAPNEGKTSIVTNLAISLAQMGQKVLLWDADLRRQRIHRIFQQNNSPGLTDFLVDENKSSEDYPLSEDYHLGEPFIRSTEVENLYIFPAGRYVSNPEMLLSSEKMKQLVKSLMAEYDIILFDSSPLLSAADAMTLATNVDRTLMVIRSGETKRQIALQGKELLENVNAEILGVVLNGIDYSKQYGSYYHSYRSYYSGDEKEE